MKRYTILLIFILTVILAQSCGIYSFTGATYGDAKTVSVAFFPNRAPLVQPTLSQVFTERLKDKFLSQTPLAVVSNGGDLHFEGEITGYQTQPAAIVAGETAPSNRLTITIRVKFTNQKDEKFNYDNNFSRFADYASNKNLLDVEEQLISEILTEIIDDIFNKAVVNW